MCRVWRLLRLLLLTLLLTTGARAEEQAKRRVEIVLVGKLSQDPVFAARVTSWFPSERFQIVVRRAPFLQPRQVLAPSGDADVHVWVTLAGDELARLYFSSPDRAGSGESYFLRDLRLERGLDEIGAEHVAEVLHLSTQAFLDGQAQSARAELERTLQTESASEPAPPVATKPPPRVAAQVDEAKAPRRPVRREWGAAVGYGGSYRADEGVWHGPRASLEAALLGQLGVRLGVQGFLPQARELEPLELRFYGASFLVAGSWRHALGSSVTLQWFVGPGLDVVRYDPLRALSSDYATAAAATEARPQVGFGLCASFGRLPLLHVIAEATVPLTKTHYDVVQGNQRRVIGRASPIAPTLGLELGF